jgi:prevent-host-death family protein
MCLQKYLKSGIITKLNYKGCRKMQITNIHEAEAHLSQLIERVMAGEEIIIKKGRQPVAKLVPYEPSHEPRQPGGELARQG